MKRRSWGARSHRQAYKAHYNQGGPQPLRMDLVRPEGFEPTPPKGTALQAADSSQTSSTG
jgi:hypothetical protein